MFKRMKGLGVLALALALPLTGCDEASDPELGSVSLLLTDAADPEITEAWVTFTDIYLQGDSGDEDPAGGRAYLLEDAEYEVELTELQGEVAELVEGEEVATGTYGQLRVVLGGACIVTADGHVFSSSEEYTACGASADGRINLTSADNSGWKVLLNGLQVDGDQEVILLDFLVDESFFKQAGNSNQYVLTPVIRGANVTLTGGFDVALSDPDDVLDGTGFTPADFNVTMTPAEGDVETEAFLDDDEDGLFTADFDFETAGQEYTFLLEGPDGLEFTVEPAEEQTLDLESGETLDLEWVLTSAEVLEGAS